MEAGEAYEVGAAQAVAGTQGRIAQGVHTVPERSASEATAELGLIWEDLATKETK